MKKNLLAGAMALALIGCAQEKAAQEAAPDAEQVASEVAPAAERAADAAVPGLLPTVVPGVAFDYAFAFRLDDDRISQVQQDHAEACELLGLARCRIVDVRYGLGEDKNVSAGTRFKLDPGIARRFGADAIASVEKAEGVLTEATVAGEDVGTQITASQERSAGNAAEIDRIEARLQQRGLGQSERAELRSQLAVLRGQQDKESTARRTGEARIASTSVVFTYVGTGGVPGIGHDNPFSTASETFLRSGSTALSILLTFGAAILPWALVLTLLILLWRSGPVRGARQRWNAPAKANVGLPPS